VLKQIQKWLSEGINHLSCSVYASPVVLLKKKNDTLWLCIDYRELNIKILQDHYPLPLIDWLRGAVVFWTLDLSYGFFHVAGEASVKYKSVYEFLRTPFRLYTYITTFFLEIFHFQFCFL